MNHLIKNFKEFLLENIDSNIELIEDYFLEFCDDYNLDITVEIGHLVNDNYVTTKILPDILQMAKQENVGIDIKDCYRVQLFSKEHRKKELHNPGIMPELGDNWKDSINDDFIKCVSRIEKSTNLTSYRLPNLQKSNWSITFYFIVSK